LGKNLVEGVERVWGKFPEIEEPVKKMCVERVHEDYEELRYLRCEKHWNERA
jgi:hypothetical protein